MKNEDLLNDIELRNKLVDKLEVLEKVKLLLTIPNTDWMTTQQVSDYYEVNTEAIQKVYQGHKDEFDLDGVEIRPYKDFLIGDSVQLETLKGKVILKYQDGSFITIPNRGIKAFPRRAILRIGMLLRDSKVAKEVRNQLLNIEEKVSDDIKVADINEEQSLIMSLGMAVMSGDSSKAIDVFAKMMEYKNRHIQKLEDKNQVLLSDNKLLSEDILTWSDRSKLNAGVRKVALNTHTNYSEVWSDLYRNLKYKYHIDVKNRGKKPYISSVRENEWGFVQKIFSAMCEQYGLNPSEMLK